MVPAVLDEQPALPRDDEDETRGDQPPGDPSCRGWEPQILLSLSPGEPCCSGCGHDDPQRQRWRQPFRPGRRMVSQLDQRVEQHHDQCVATRENPCPRDPVRRVHRRRGECSDEDGQCRAGGQAGDAE
ncbi:hypothetical protein SDC9_153277 [bioreactor metagenome]|uniref:Uncharacterized protein n=1 Tax=bioreactor metagenome TaxID=1076179 RepID=A0A645F042_9ZZZZ